jgi:uncharacterized membrane protein YukC
LKPFEAVSLSAERGLKPFETVSLSAESIFTTVELVSEYSDGTKQYEKFMEKVAKKGLICL